MSKRQRTEETGPSSWDLSSHLGSEEPIPIAGSWTSENDPVSFFLTHDPAQAAGLLGLTTVRYTDSLDAQLATTYLDHFKAGIAELGTRCVSLTDAVMAHTQDADFVDFMCSLLTVKELPCEEHARVLTFAELQDIKRTVVAGMTPQQLAHSLSNHTDIDVTRDQSGLVKIASYKVTPMTDILHDRMHICTPLGFAIARSRVKRHSLRLLSYVLQKLGMPRVRTVPMPLRMSGLDYVPLGPELTLFGTGPLTDEATVRYLMDDDALGTATVAMVRNLFDRGDDARASLERVFKFIGGSCVVVAACVLGAKNPRRRLVSEFRRAGGARTDLGGPLSGPAYDAEASLGSDPATDEFEPLNIPRSRRGSMMGAFTDPGAADEDPNDLMGGGVNNDSNGNNNGGGGTSSSSSDSGDSGEGASTGGHSAANVKVSSDKINDDEESDSEEQHSHHTYALTRADVELGEYLEAIGLSIIAVPDDIFDRAGLGIFNTGDGNLLVADPGLAELIRGHSAFKGSVKLQVPPEGSDEHTAREWFRHVRSHSMVIRRPDPSTTARFAKDGKVSRAPLYDSTDDGLVPGPPGIGEYFAPKRSKNIKRQSTSTVLMVAPVGFGRNEETAKDNQYMRATSLAQTEIERRALDEFSLTHLELVSRGVKVMLFSSERFHRTPDACFPNNWMSTHPPGELATGTSTLVFYPMATVSRRAERRENIVSALQSMYDREISFVQWEAADFPHFLESTGVLILDRLNRVAYATLSQRCYRRISETWARRMGYDLCLFSMTDEHGRPCYHTNVMMSLGTSCAVICLEAVTNDAQRADITARLAKAGREVVDISRRQVEQFCGNVLEIRDGKDRPLLVMSRRAMAAFTPQQITVLRKHFHDLVAVPVETIEDIGGGGIRCMLSEIF